MPLIALEVVLGFVVPVGWGVWELMSLRRDRQRMRRVDRSENTAPSEVVASGKGSDSKPDPSP